MDIKDRIVEHPNRYRLKPVEGQPGVYDIEPEPGEVTESGTLINAELFRQLLLLSPETAALYGLTGEDATVDRALNLIGNRLLLTVPPPGTPLTDFSWEQIALISEGGMARVYFNIGDTKNITVNSETLTLQIYGFDHDTKTGGGKAGITFGTMHLMATKRTMNATETNTTSWNTSQLRGWFINTLLGQLPADLQAVLKPVNKLTSAGGQSATILTTSDKVFLFSEVEIYGSNLGSFAGEGSKYPIFTTDTSRIKKLSNGSGVANIWWTRSPHNASSTHFRVIGATGVPAGTPAQGTGTPIMDYGIAFGFCV